MTIRKITIDTSVKYIPIKNEHLTEPRKKNLSDKKLSKKHDKLNKNISAKGFKKLTK